MNYQILADQVREIIRTEPWYAAALSNLSALIMSSVPDLNWAGFYLMREGRLTVGPFQGKPACIHIPVGKGVCGTAVETDSTQIVPDVHLFPGHIACDGDSASELVIPLHGSGGVVGVMDLDSPLKNRFSQADADGLKEIARILENDISW
ncbi:MAG: GAF domain-containing protein [Clostridiales bacterium]|nr:GAF domain-containing protein [Clostridiales bacterium]